MGVCSSQKKKLSTHNNCNCLLYGNYGHCCKNQCLFTSLNTFKQNLLHQLTVSFQSYNADMFVNMVIEYLPDPIYYGKIVRISFINDNDYQLYAHESFNNVYTKKQTSPCRDWINYFDYLKGTIQVVMDGGDGCGKSCLTHRLIKNEWLPDCDTSIHPYASYSSSRQRKNHIYVFSSAIDWRLTDGDKDECGYDDEHYEHCRQYANLFLLCFAINDKKSFAKLSFYRDRILRIKDDFRKNENSNRWPWAMILVGNK
eukprot:234256_1